ncbi:MULTISPECIES: HAD family hydrolase [unclassified Rhizobium]|uniref:HAD family hydrolase n=1 Tax=unclassified Rhizobium TaxID=2613769 RepID=UPI00381E2479
MTDCTVLNGATVAFDLDGTLVESAVDVIGAVNAVLIDEGVRPLDYARSRPFVSRGARWLLQSGLAAAGAGDPGDRTSVLFERFINYYAAHIADESKPFPGAITALKTLRAAGVTLVVCTNKPTALARRLLCELDMIELFADVVGIDAVSASKPAAAHLIEAISAVGGEISRSIMVGDAEADARCARAAGVPLILVSFGYTEIPAVELAPDVLLHRFEDLVGACSELLHQASPGEARG